MSFSRPQRYFRFFLLSSRFRFHTRGHGNRDHESVCRSITTVARSDLKSRPARVALRLRKYTRTIPSIIRHARIHKYTPRRSRAHTGPVSLLRETCRRNRKKITYSLLNPYTCVTINLFCLFIVITTLRALKSRPAKHLSIRIACLYTHTQAPILYNIILSFAVDNSAHLSRRRDIVLYIIVTPNIS